MRCRHSRVGAACAAVLVSSVIGCGQSGDVPGPTAVGGALEVAPDASTGAANAGPPTDRPSPERPPSDTVAKAISADAFVRALKSHPLPAPPFPDPNILSLEPAPPSRPGDPIVERLYASSRLIEGGEGVVSRLQSPIAPGDVATLDWFVSSGTDSWYVANGELTVGSRDTLRFDGVLRLRADQPVPLDRDLAEWRVESPQGVARLALTAESVDDAPGAFAACWRMRVPDALDRKVCTVHGAPVVARVSDFEARGAPRVSEARPATAPWNERPPEGTPAPPPDPRPIRTIPGEALTEALRHPAFSSYADPPFGQTVAAEVELRAADAPGSIARLSSALSLAPVPNQYGTWDTRLASSIADVRLADGTGWPTAAVDARIDVLRFGARLVRAAATVDGATASFDSNQVAMGAGTWFPLDRTIRSWEGQGLRLELVLQSVDGPSRGWRACWRTLSATVDRLACSVHDVPGETGRVVDMRGGRTISYR